MDCGALVSDLRRRLESRENLDFIAADLEYGVEAELEEFTRRLLILLINTIEETHMSDTRSDGLSTSPQQAITDINPASISRTLPSSRQELSSVIST